MSAEPSIPLGAQVVVHGVVADGSGSTGRGISGRVIQRRGTAYGVALLDGRRTEVPLDRLTVVDEPEPEPKHSTHGGNAALVSERTIYAAVVGESLDVGTGAAGAEVDIRGVYQAATSAFWRLSKPPKHVAGPGPSWFSWEVERFCELALKANPGCLEVLWSPRAIWMDRAGRELLGLRGAFLSQTIASAYSTYVLAQFKKLEENDRSQGEQRWWQAAHLLRLLMDGIAFLRTGDVADSVAEQRERLMALRSGQVSWDDVEAWRLELQRRIEEAGSSSFLPPHPDTERVNAWLSDLRRRDVAREAPNSGAGDDR